MILSIETAGIVILRCVTIGTVAAPSQRFAFWVTAINLNSNRGVERVQTFANTIIDINCAENDTTADTEKVLSFP